MSSIAPSPPAVLLGTKLNAPLGARRRVPREGLVQRLVRERPRLVLIDAPAGWGKTTLLAEWAMEARETRPFAWFTVDAVDNDPVRFWSYVLEALRGIDPRVGRRSAAALGVSGTDPVELVLPQLINELSELDDEIVLVLEDYHLVSNEDIHRGVAFLLERAPLGLELVVATRIDPPFPLPRLRARGDLLELRAADLRFGADETARLVADVIGAPLDQRDVEMLVTRTEGWAAGLYLAALSIAERSDRSAFIEHFAGDDRHIVDYLGGEVLEGLDEDTRDFLLRTAILDRVTGPLADTLTGRTDGARKLADIERANLFLIPLDDRREWYRYHHLFAELLRHEQMRSGAGDVDELHRRAAAWLDANGAVDDAIRHACAAGDHELAVALVARRWREPFNRGELATVDSWLDALPAIAVAAEPDLCLARAWIALDRGRPREAERWLDGATRGGSGEAAVLHAVLCFKLGKLTHAEQLARDARAIASEEAPLGLAVASCILGITLYYKGDLAAGLETLREASRLAFASDNTLAAIYALGYSALVALELGDEQGARLSIDHAVDLASTPATAEHFVAGMVWLARGRLESDEQALDSALALARRGAAALEVASVLLALGEVRRDPATLRAASDELADCEDPGRLPRLIQAAELRLRGRQTGAKRQIAGDLSDRELAVLRLMPTESSLREIAKTLYLSPNTVKTHTRSIYRKLGVSSREEAVERGRGLGLV